MKLFSIYVGQGCLSVLVGDTEAVIIDAHIPSTTDEHAEHVRRVLATVLAGKRVRGLLLTGFDADHADHRGVAWILRRYQPDWLVYPTYFKDSKTAATIFRKVINKIYGADLKADVLAAPHHGSKNAINKQTLKYVDPHTVIISCGVKNQYGHPDAEAIALCERYATKVLCTENGTSFETSPSAMWTVSSCPWSVDDNKKAA